MTLFGIDVGSSVCKSVMFDERCDALSQSLVEYGEDHPWEGMAA